MDSAPGLNRATSGYTTTVRGHEPAERGGCVSPTCAPAKPFTAAVVSDDDELAALVEVILELDPRFTVQPKSGCGAADVVVVDVGDAELDGLCVLRQLRHAMPEVRLVAFSPLPDPLTLLATVGGGADAYVSAAALWSELVPTLALVCGNH